MKKIILSLFFIVTIPYFCLAANIKTPLEKSNYSSLTMNKDLVNYLEKLDSKSKIVSMEIIGKSVQGKKIPALFFTLDKKFGLKRVEKPIVMVLCQQHGNEPSGKEAALILAGSLLKKDRLLLKNLDLILIPQVNPDGADAGERRNANKMDINRNHVILSEPESQAIHNLFIKWMPEVTLDIHEYNAVSSTWAKNGIMKDAEQTLGCLTNLNIDKSILDFSKKIIIPAVGENITKKGFTYHEYMVGAPFKNMRIRYSTTAINDGRQSFGIYNTLSFIQEGKRYGDLTTKIKRRTLGQLEGLKTFLMEIGKNKEKVLSIVSAARKNLISNKLEEFVHIQMDYFKSSKNDKVIYPVFDLSKWKHKDMEMENYYSTVKIKKSVKRPAAYIFSAKEERLIKLLNRHQIEYVALKENKKLTVEQYKILHITKTIEEDKSAENIDAYRENITKKFNKGDIIIPINQPAANVIPLLLEPQSSWAIVTERTGRKYRFKEYIQVGQVYPVYRILNDINPKIKNNK